MARPVSDVSSIREFSSGLEQPAGLAAAPDGGLFVSHIEDGHGVISRITPDGSSSLFARTGGRPAGLALDRQGSLFAADVDRRVVLRISADGGVEDFVKDANGATFKAPQDLAFGPLGNFFLTDPIRRAPPDPSISPVYRITTEGEAFLFADELAYPNGIAFSPDGREIYVAEMRSNRLLGFPVLSDGSAGEPRMLHRFSGSGGPAGMAVDSEGTVIVAVQEARALAFISQDAVVLDRWDMPDRIPTYPVFGGEQGRTVFVADSSTGSIISFEHSAVGAKLF